MKRTTENDGLYPPQWYADHNPLDPANYGTDETPSATQDDSYPPHWSNPGLMFDPAYHPSTHNNEETC